MQIADVGAPAMIVANNARFLAFVFFSPRATAIFMRFFPQAMNAVFHSSTARIVATGFSGGENGLLRIAIRVLGTPRSHSNRALICAHHHCCWASARCLGFEIQTEGTGRISN